MCRKELIVFNCCRLKELAYIVKFSSHFGRLQNECTGAAEIGRKARKNASHRVRDRADPVTIPAIECIWIIYVSFPY